MSREKERETALSMEYLRGLKTVVYGLAGFVLLLVLTSCGGDDDSVPATDGGQLTIGDTVETETGTVTIRSYEVLVAAEDDEVQPPAGFSFAVVEMEGCVSRTLAGVVTIYAEDVQLELADGTRLAATRAAREPALQPITNVQSGDCARGFLTYGVPEGSEPALVTYEVIPRSRVAEQQGVVTLRWMIP